MDNSEDKMLRLVDMVYDAALDEHKWPIFLEAFARAVGGCSSMLRSTDFQAGKAEFVASVGYNPAWQAAYRNHFVKLDYLTPGLTRIEPGEAKTGEYLLSQAEQRKTEMYNDYLLPQDKQYTMGVLLIKDGNQMLSFAAQRGKRAGAFGEEQARLMSILAPHVTRAVQVQRRISSVTVEKDWALGALDHLRMGVILTNSSGTPIFVNRAAEQMLTPSQGIGVYHDRLVLNTTPETARLYQLITDAAQGTPGTSMGGDMRIALPTPDEFLHCMVMPISLELSARLNISFASGCAAVFLSRPGGLQLSPKRLAVLYGLTLAEAKLAAKIATGMSVEEAANGLHIAYETARTQLRAVFAKTGATRQTELVSLLLTGVLAHCGDGTVKINSK